MASSNFPFPEGNFINRPLMFNGKGYHYWKTRMHIFIEAIDLKIWEVIEFDPFILTMVERKITIKKILEKKKMMISNFVKRFNEFMRNKRSKEIKYQSREERKRFLLSPKML